MKKKYETGKKYIELVSVADGVKIDFSDNKGRILLQYGRPDEREASNVSAGRFRIQERILGGVMFFAFKFGDLNWMDAPYTPHLSRNPLPEDIEDSCKSGMEIDIVLADRNNGRVVSIRRVTIDSGFSRKMLKDSESLLQETFLAEKHDRTVDAMYANYSSADMVRLTNTNRGRVLETENLKETEMDFFTEEEQLGILDPGSLKRWQIEMAKIYNTVPLLVQAGMYPAAAIEQFAKANDLSTRYAPPNKIILYEEGSARALIVTLGRRNMHVKIVYSPAYELLDDYDTVIFA